MTKFLNTGDAIDLYFPAGHPDTLQVGEGQTVDLGDLKVEEGDDCWLVGEGDNVRAWSKARWEKQGAAKKSEPKTTVAGVVKPADNLADKTD